VARRGGLDCVVEPGCGPLAGQWEAWAEGRHFGAVVNWACKSVLRPST
jgi:hypothetical protein